MVRRSGSFGKRKKGLRYCKTSKKPTTYLCTKKRTITFTPGKSPFLKKQRLFVSPSKCPQKIISKKKLNLSSGNKEYETKNPTMMYKSTEQKSSSDSDNSLAEASYGFKMPTEILRDIEKSDVSRNSKPSNSEFDTSSPSSSTDNPWTFHIPPKLIADLEATEVSPSNDESGACSPPLTTDINDYTVTNMEFEDSEVEKDVNVSPDSEDTHLLQQELMKLLTSVVSEFKTNGKEEILRTFFTLVAKGEFPFQNIAFRLWCDVVRWFSNSDTRQMRYSPECLQFFWVGQKLFGGRFVRFMSGMKNEEEMLLGSTKLDPRNSKLNFACPSENVLRGINPIGDMPMNYKPGILEPVIQLKSKNDNKDNSYTLMLDGKKIKRGTDVNLLGFEKEETASEKLKEKENKLKKVADCTSIVTNVQMKSNNVNETNECDKALLLKLFMVFIHMFSLILKQMRKTRLKKTNFIARLKEESGENWRKSKNAYSIDTAMTILWKIDNLVDRIMKVIKCLCKVGSHLNRSGHNFSDGDTVNLNTQENVKILKSPDALPLTTDTPLIKQKTERWHNDRKKMFVTGSTIYQAIGCDTLKRQKEHFDKKVNGIEPPERTDVEIAAMQHGVETEVHQIATLCGIIMPLLYPSLVFHEEGYYYTDNILVSPDGSLRTSDGNTVFAFEGKAPSGNRFKTTLHDSIPERYVTQTLYEQKSMDAEGTIYMSWTEQSCTVFKVLPDDDICTAVAAEVDKVYYGENTKKPNRISNEAKRIKGILANASKRSEFIGEFPSVKGVLNESIANMTVLGESDAPNPYLPIQSKTKSNQVLEYDELQRHLLAGKEIIEEAYELERLIATQVVVYLIADTDRFYKQEEPHAVPVMYFYRGPSLSMDIARNLTEKCKEVCRSNGLDVVACAADGEFTPMIVRGRKDNPLTLNQLSKDIWKEANQMSKTSILNTMTTETKEYIVLTCSDNGDKHVSVCSSSGNLRNIKTPTKGWKCPNEKPCELMEDVIEVEEADITMTTASVESNINISTEQTQRIDENNEHEQTHEEQSVESTETNQTRPATQEAIQLNTIEFLDKLRVINEKKWSNKSQEDIQAYFSSAESLKKFTVKELTELTKEVNKGRPESECLKVSGNGMKKHVYVNQLSQLLGDGTKMKEIRRIIKNPLSLKVAAQRIVMRKTYPKKVLNIAFSNFIWRRRVEEWKKKARVNSTVLIECLESELKPYYVPDESVDGDFELFIYDKTHLGSNLRKCLCLDNVHGISKQAWQSVVEKEPNVLNPMLIEVNEERKIVDQMKERLARNMVSPDVEKCMLKNGFEKEALFCRIIREGLYEADDKPGISAVERCRMRMSLIEWLDEGVDFGDFPPYGRTIKGMSTTLYEGMRISNEAKMYLYAITKKGTYNTRAPNTLCSESFFSTLQEMDAWGQGILTAEGIEKQISDFTTITAMKMNHDRSFFIRTKMDTAYPNQELEPDVPQIPLSNERMCTCRRDKYIKCIVPRNHFFDTEQRARLKKSAKPYRFSGFNQPAAGDQPIRSQYGYKINETKVLLSRRLGINILDQN